MTPRETLHGAAAEALSIDPAALAPGELAAYRALLEALAPWRSALREPLPTSPGSPRQEPPFGWRQRPLPSVAQPAALLAWARALTPKGLWPSLPLREALLRLLAFREHRLATRGLIGTGRDWPRIDRAFRRYMACKPATAEEEFLMRTIAVNSYHLPSAYRHQPDLAADLARLGQEAQTKSERFYALALLFDSASRLPADHPEYIDLMAKPLPPEKEAVYREAFRDRDLAQLTAAQLGQLAADMMELFTYIWSHRTIQRLDPAQWQSVLAHLKRVAIEVIDRCHRDGSDKEKSALIHAMDSLVPASLFLGLSFDALLATGHRAAV